MSGYTSVGYVPRPETLKADKSYERDRDKYQFVKQKSWHYQSGICEQVIIQPLHNSNSGSRLVSASKSSQTSETPKKRYGLKGISPAGRTKVRESAYLLHRLHPRRLGFYTLTCPYTTPSQIYEFNRNISEILRQYFQMLKRAEAGIESFQYVSVLEVQEQRYLHSGDFVLHIHYISPCFRPGSRVWKHTANELRTLWARACRNVVGGEPDTSASVDCQLVKKNAAAYLSKYMSKGGKLQSEVASVSPSQLPRQWWSISAMTRRLLHVSTITLPSETAENFFHNSFVDGELNPFMVCHHVTANIGGNDVCIGVAGYLHKDWTSALWEEQRFSECMDAIRQYELCHTLDKTETAS